MKSFLLLTHGIFLFISQNFSPKTNEVSHKLLQVHRSTLLRPCSVLRAYSVRSNYPVAEFLKVKLYSIVITKQKITIYSNILFEVLLIQNSKIEKNVCRKQEDFSRVVKFLSRGLSMQLLYQGGNLSCFTQLYKSSSPF